MAWRMAAPGDSFTVVPLYGQVFVGDARAADYPQFDSGEEPVVSTAHAVVVATRSDADGKVTMDVHHGLGPAALPGWDEQSTVFDGELLLPSGLLLVGSQTAQDFRTFELTGTARVRIAVDEPGMASRVHVWVRARSRQP
jgi:hypothetical protein